MANMQQMLFGTSSSAFLLDYGGSGQINLSATDSFPGGSSSATVAVELYADGTGKYILERLNGALEEYTFNWLTGSGSVANYYAYMDNPSVGTFTFGTTGSAVQLNSSQSWSLTIFSNAGNGTQTDTVNSTLRIRNSAGVDLTSKTISFFVSATA
jgi:hypothetical protein